MSTFSATFQFASRHDLRTTGFQRTPHLTATSDEVGLSSNMTCITTVQYVAYHHSAHINIDNLNILHRLLLPHLCILDPMHNIQTLDDPPKHRMFVI